MAVRPQDVYRGKRPYSKLIIVLLCIVLALLAAAVVLFFSLQKYIVYGQDGLSLELPILSTPEPAEVSGAPQVSTDYDIPTEIVIATPNFDEVVTDAGQELKQLKAVYVTAEQMAETEDLTVYAQSQAETWGANGLVFQLKPESGQLSYLSAVELTDSYAVNGTANIRDAVAALKEQGLYLVAELSVCVDELMATRNVPLALKDMGGAVYTDEKGAWLDPYNRQVRYYIEELMLELAQMGFDELLLTHVAHPEAVEGVVYSQDMTSAMDTVSCVSNLALRLTEAVGEQAKVSVVYEGTGGQDGAFFGRVFDRLYCYTNAGALETQRVSIGGLLQSGDVNRRFVPVMQTTADNGSWVLRESEADEEES